MISHQLAHRIWLLSAHPAVRGVVGEGLALLPTTSRGPRPEGGHLGGSGSVGSSKGTGTGEGKNQLPSLPSPAFQRVPCKSLPLLYPGTRGPHKAKKQFCKIGEHGWKSHHFSSGKGMSKELSGEVGRRARVENRPRKEQSFLGVFGKKCTEAKEWPKW